MNKPLVFISYSHRDETEKQQLVAHLKVLETSDLIELWVDDKIEGGASWEQEIKSKIAQAKLVILLISANFLTSEFILGKEIPDFLNRRQKEGLVVFPIIAKSCAWESFDWLVEMNVRPKNGTPIWTGNSEQAVDHHLTAITREIRTIIKNRATANPTFMSPANRFSFPAYSSFQSDLEKLIQEAVNDFAGIRAENPESSSEGFLVYKTTFTFEYSFNNTIWRRDDGSWYFTCSFCDDTSLQEAEKIFTERVQEIKPILANEWKFQERDKPNSLHRKEFEATRKYNTLRMMVEITAFNQGNSSQVNFTLEQLKH